MWNRKNPSENAYVLKSNEKLCPITPPVYPGDRIVYQPVRSGLYRANLTVGAVYTVRPGFLFAEIRNKLDHPVYLLSEDLIHFQKIQEKQQNHYSISKKTRKKMNQQSKTKK